VAIKLETKITVIFEQGPNLNMITEGFTEKNLSMICRAMQPPRPVQELGTIHFGPGDGFNMDLPSPFDNQRSRENGIFPAPHAQALGRRTRTAYQATAFAPEEAAVRTNRGARFRRSGCAQRHADVSTK